MLNLLDQMILKGRKKIKKIVLFFKVSKVAINWANILDEVIVTNIAEKPEIIQNILSH